MYLWLYRCVMRISAVFLTLSAKQTTSNQNSQKKRFSHLHTASGFWLPLLSRNVSSTIMLVQVRLRLCVCFVRWREGCTEFGKRKKGLQYHNQSNVSYCFRSSFKGTYFCVRCFLLKYDDQTGWSSSSDSNYPTVRVMGCFLWKI